MTLPTSGAISLSQVNTELGLAANTAINLNQANVRALAGVASGAISMSNLYGKSTLTLIATFSVSLVRYPTSGYHAFSAAPDRFYWIKDTSLGTMLGYSTWEFVNTVYEPSSAYSNAIAVQLTGRSTPYTGVTTDSINAIEINGVIYPVDYSYTNMNIIGSYSCTWSSSVGELALATGANTIKVYK
jgi:hypothetical protein